MMYICQIKARSSTKLIKLYLEEVMRSQIAKWNRHNQSYDYKQGKLECINEVAAR